MLTASSIASSPTALIETHFGGLKDHRASHQIEHKLIDMIIITICATISGADDWKAIAEYGVAKYDLLKTFLELPNGIPSHDTFNRLFSRLKPEELQRCFIGWTQAVHQVTEGELLNIDGKNLRGAVITRKFPKFDLYGKCLVSITSPSTRSKKSRLEIQ
jgi:hypothetical protein